MNTSNRVKKLEKQQKTLIFSVSDNAAALWLETLTNDELDFLEKIYTSEECRAANAAKTKRI